MTQALAHHRYIVRSRIGHGNLGVVYRATDRLNGRTVALKRFHHPVPGENRTHLANTFAALIRLRHPALSPIFDYDFDDEGHPFFTMPFIGLPVNLFEAADALPFEKKVDVLVQVLQGLVALHGRGLRHGNLRPSNVLVQDGRAILLDYGLNGEALQLNENSTLVYLAPERLAEQVTPTVQSDLYAFGMMAYRILTGDYPFPINDKHKLLMAIRGTAPDMTPLARLADDYGLKLQAAWVEMENKHARLPVNIQPRRYPTQTALPDIVGRLLEKTPEARYRDAGRVMRDMCGAIDRALPAMPSIALRDTFAEPPLVNRQEELSRLLATLDHTVRHRQGSTWILRGEAGAGKSRLLEALVHHARARSMYVLRGTARHSTSPVYGVWRELLRHLVLAVQPDSLEASVLKPILPDVDGLLGVDVPDALPLGEIEARQRLITTLADLFRRLSRPVLLLLDNMHLADESLQPLRLLARLSTEAPLVIVVAGQMVYPDRITRILPTATPLELAPFKPDDIEQMSVAFLGEAGRQHLVLRFLNAYTGGNPLFLVETLRALAEEPHALGNLHRTWLRPETVADVVAHRLRGLTALDLHLLKLAALAGPQIDPQLLTTISGADNVLGWLAKMERRAFFAVQDGNWYLAHDTLRHILLRLTAPLEAPVLHRQIATVLPHLYPGDATLNPRLAYHWHQAGDPAKATHYALLAARDWLWAGNTQSVIDLCEPVLHTLPPLSSSDHLYLALLLAEAYLARADLDNSRLFFQRALQASRETQDRAGSARAAYGLGQVATAENDLQKARNWYLEALLNFHEAGDIEQVARTLHALGITTSRLGDLDAAETYFSEALEIARQREDRFWIARCLNSLGVLFNQRSDFRAARTMLRESLALCRAVGDKLTAARVLINLSAASRGLNDLNRATDELTESLEIMREMNNQHGVARVLYRLGEVSSAGDHFLAARTYYEQSRNLAAQINDAALLIDNLLNLAFDCVRQEQPEHGKAFMLKALPLALEQKATEGLLKATATAAHLYAFAGRYDRSAELLGLFDKHRDHHDPMLGAVSEWLHGRLKTRLSLGDMIAALERGAAGDLAPTAQSLLSEMTH